MVAAEVSGVAENSNRTDLGVLKQSTQVPPATQPVRSYTGGAYGNNKDMRIRQGAAPMAGNPLEGLGSINLTPLSSPTSFPDESGTAGIDTGLGGGSELMMDRPVARPSLANTLQKLAMFDDTGEAELINQFNR